MNVSSWLLPPMCEHQEMRGWKQTTVAGEEDSNSVWVKVNNKMLYSQKENTNGHLKMLVRNSTQGPGLIKTSCNKAERDKLKCKSQTANFWTLPLQKGAKPWSLHPASDTSTTTMAPTRWDEESDKERKKKREREREHNKAHPHTALGP